MRSWTCRRWGAWLLCWLYSAPGEADHHRSSFSRGLSCSLAFPQQEAWERARENSARESRKWQGAGIESDAGVCSWGRGGPLVQSFSSVWRPWMLFKAQTMGGTKKDIKKIEQWDLVEKLKQSPTISWDKAPAASPKCVAVSWVLWKWSLPCSCKQEVRLSGIWMPFPGLKGGGSVVVGLPISVFPLWVLEMLNLIWL